MSDDDDTHLQIAATSQRNLPVETSIVPLWSNLKLPMQEYSWTAHAAQLTRTVLEYVPENVALSGSKRRKEDECTYHVPIDQQTALVMDAYLALALVTVMYRAGDVKFLLAAEKAELQAAVGKGCTDFASGKPRRYALTLLIPQSSTCADRSILLDSMALLSRESDASIPAIKEVRMAVLADKDAIFYAENTGRHTMEQSTHSAEIVLVYVTDEGVRTAVYTSLKQGVRAKVAFKILTKAIAKLFQEADLTLLPSLGRSSDVESNLIDGAYKKGMQEANDEFWSELSSHSPPPSLDYKLSFGPSGNLENRIFLKIAPVGMALDHPEVYFGLLLYEEGKGQELHDYAVEAMKTERAVMQLPDDAPIGLRAPVTTKERVSQPHVLTVRATTVSFRDRLSSFGLRGAPGYRVSEYDNASMPKLLYTLQPFNDDFTRMKFVLPCTQDQTDSLNDRFAMAQSRMAMDAIRSYGDVCGLSEDARGQMPSSAPFVDSVFKIKKLKEKASSEDTTLSTMVGMPVGSAFRLGDVLERVSFTKQSMPVLNAFLTASIARLGRNASMAEALDASVKLEKVHEKEVATLNVKMQTLQDHQHIKHIKDAKNTQRLKKQIAAPNSVQPCSLAAMKLCFDGMNLKRVGGTPLVTPITQNRAIAIVRVLARARCTESDDSAALPHWNECKDMDIVNAAACLGRNIHKCPIFVVFVHRGQQKRVDFLKANCDATASNQLEKVSPMEMYDAPSKHESFIMLKYVEDAGKLFALVPKD